MFMKILRAVRAAIDQIEKRPWIPMVAYLACFTLFVLVAWIPIANLIDSQWRPLPVLSASAKLMIDEVVYWIYRLLYAVGVVSVVVVPFVMLCAIRFKSAFYTFVMGMSGVALSCFFMLATAPIWFVLGIEDLHARQEMGKDITVKVYEDYAAAAAKSKDLGKIIPPGANDITVVSQVYFQGYSDNFRCHISNEDFKKFVAERKYVCKEFDIEKDFGSPQCFNWDKENDPLFSQFPKMRNGKMVDHHSDGFLGCVANDRIGGGNPNERSLQYVYDTKCSTLWAQCYW